MDRQLRPNQEKHIANHEFGREMWLEMGKQGLLGTEDPRPVRGGRLEDPRFAPVLAEELSKVAFACSSCVGIHADFVPPYLVDLCTRSRSSAGCPRSHRRAHRGDRP